MSKQDDKVEDKIVEIKATDVNGKETVVQWNETRGGAVLETKAKALTPQQADEAAGAVLPKKTAKKEAIKPSPEPKVAPVETPIDTPALHAA